MIPFASRPLLAAVLFVVGAACFSTAYCQSPLYYSNQNQYFLHGLAAAGEGDLHADWLANTADPTPVFSGLVAVTARVLPPWAFHVYQAILYGVYLASVLAIFAYLVGPDVAARRWPIFLAGLFLFHAAALRWLSYRLVGQDYPWYFQSGVAGQYVLGSMLQPSVFGVLLVAAIACFVHDRPFLAAIFVAVSATVHSTYLLPGAFLTAGFLVSFLREQKWSRALLVAIVTLVLVLPVTMYVAIRFSPTSPEQFPAAQDILANFRIPHHTRVDLWLDTRHSKSPLGFDLVAALQIAWVVGAIIAAWRTRLCPIVSIAFLLSLLLTIAQVITGSATLALLFPWRISAILVPLATVIFLSRLTGLPVEWLGHRVTRTIAICVIGVLVAAGAWITIGGHALRLADDEVPMMDFVRRSRVPGDVYLLPVHVPDLLETVHGSGSSDFKPVAEKRHDAQVIPIDLQRFRLYTGTPIYVDFKAIPYKDVDVLEWRRRLDWAEQATRQPTPDFAKELHERGITHFVVPATQFELGPRFEEVYHDAMYRVYRVTRRE
jgi:hypothetical protein